MGIEEFDHYTVRASDFDASWQFYNDALGLRCVPRDGSARAAFVYIGDTDRWLVHLSQGDPSSSPDAPSKSTTGRLVHIAVNATGLQEMRDRLRAHDVEFRERTLESRSLRQIHLLDPDGIEIEINFPLAETASS